MTAEDATLDAQAERVLAAARAQFLEFGLRRTSLDHIAQAAGMSRATLFRRFPNREALILALATAVEPWLAALIVTAAYAAIAGVLAFTGRQRVQAGTPPVPEQAIDSTKEDIERAKRSAKEARA